MKSKKKSYFFQEPNYIEAFMISSLFSLANYLVIKKKILYDEPSLEMDAGLRQSF